MKGISALLQLIFVFSNGVFSSDLPWEQYARSPDISISQARALFDFYTATGMETSHLLWFNSLSNATNYCDFQGIKCDDDDYIVSIDASRAGLYGTIPASLGDLERLNQLHLPENFLHGDIPASFTQLSMLVHLNIRGNEISGRLPDFSNMTLLKRLLLDRNALTGTIPTSLCNLKDLLSLDLSLNTRLVGILPSCFSNLTNLEVLRVTNVGLVGSVPSGLCVPRAMNGLVNNTFGCDAVACQPGTCRLGNGRQVSNETPCQPCGVPSNVLGSTICQWVYDVGLVENGRTEPLGITPSPVPSSRPSTVPNGEPSGSPSTLPSSVPSPFPSPFPSTLPHRVLETSVHPSSHQNMPSISPTSLPSKQDYTPFSSPQTVDSSIPTSFPTLIPTALSQSPSTHPQNPDASKPVDGIAAGVPTLGNDTKGQGIVVGGTLSAVFIVFLTAVVLWKRKHRRADRSEVDIIETTTSEPLDDAQQIDCLPQQSLSTIDEEDSEVGIPSASPDNSILKSSSASTNSMTPPSISDASSPRKNRVRFSLPDPISWSSDDSDDGPAAGLSDALDKSPTIPDKPSVTADTWASWIMNPVLIPSGLCVTDKHLARSFETPFEEYDGDDDQSLTPSQGSTTSQTPILPKKENVTSDFYYGLASQTQDREYTGASFHPPTSMNQYRRFSTDAAADNDSMRAIVVGDLSNRPALIRRSQRISDFDGIGFHERNAETNPNEDWNVESNPDGTIEI
ncbi:hypothetical protein ACA910_012486 [Epithemia clementina (nom. ined.)]